MIASNRSDVVNLIAGEISLGVERAVDCWMFQVEQAMTDSQLTTLGRVNAVKQVLETYKKVTGKQQLSCRPEEAR